MTSPGNSLSACNITLASEHQRWCVRLALFVVLLFLLARCIDAVAALTARIASSSSGASGKADRFFPLSASSTSSFGSSAYGDGHTWTPIGRALTIDSPVTQDLNSQSESASRCRDFQDGIGPFGKEIRCETYVSGHCPIVFVCLCEYRRGRQTIGSR